MNELTKVCTRCGIEKEFSKYHNCSSLKSGKASHCKLCQKAMNAKRSYSKQTPEQKKAEYARVKRYHQKYPEKYKARTRCKRMKPKIKGNVHHHYSYLPENSKDVIELPKELHYKLHKFLEYEQSEMCYRDVYGNLLDTKEKHLAYIEIVKQFPD